MARGAPGDRMMPLVPPLSTGSFRSFFLLSSFFLILFSFLSFSFYLSLLSSFDPFISVSSLAFPPSYPFAEHPRFPDSPQLGAARGGRMSAAVLSSPDFFMVAHRRPETAHEIRDMCGAVRAFAQRVPCRFTRFSFCDCSPRWFYIAMQNCISRARCEVHDRTKRNNELYITST